MRYWFVDCENVCNMEKFFNVFDGYDMRDKVLCVYSNKSVGQKNKFAETKPEYVRSDYCMVTSGRQSVDKKIISLVLRHLDEICINNEGSLDICREAVIISNDKGYLRHFSNTNVTLRTVSYRKTPKMYICSYVDMYRVERTNVTRKPVTKRRLCRSVSNTSNVEESKPYSNVGSISEPCGNEGSLSDAKETSPCGNGDIFSYVKEGRLFTSPKVFEIMRIWEANMTK